ncbi:PIG-L family deacetylase [bacterium]|nr:PIG-L family deacetylase [bacterium]MBU1882844.1 PIG-L family deacetylase [bacterium]
MIFYSLFSIVLAIYLFILFKRTKKYRYDTSKDYSYAMKNALQKKVTLTEGVLFIPAEYKDLDTLFLKVRLSFHPLSYFFKPFIQTLGLKHYFEYGAKGTRYINLSHLKDEHITLTCKHISIKTDDLTLYGYNNEIDLSKKIVILAPHADDAEIAAFGLYKSAKDVTIVTTTIGEHGVCSYRTLYEDKTKASKKKAELRTFDALCVPMLGGVDIKNSLALGYYGGSLKWMREHPAETAASHVKNFGDMNPFRKVSHADIKLSLRVEAKHGSFMDDLEQILLQKRPDFIITPHPVIDSHEDHKYTTYALIDAMKKTGLTCRLLTYTNHLSLSETYPVGAMHSSVTLPPNFNEFAYDGIYSFPLEDELQTDKFFALEAIHDLRDSRTAISIQKAYRQLNKMVKRKLSGKDKSYFKRAVRANELFFVIESENIDRLA